LIKLEEKNDEQAIRLYKALLDLLENPHKDKDYNEMIIN
jgi:hypothetical protein